MNFSTGVTIMGQILQTLVTMITLIASLIATAYLIGLVFMLRSMKRSPEGYEDEMGFHEGCRLGVVIDGSHEFISQAKHAA
jgi:hypothetical protein